MLSLLAMPFSNYNRHLNPLDLIRMIGIIVYIRLYNDIVK